MSEVGEVFDYLSDHPSEAEILAAVYEVKPRFNAKAAREMLGPKPKREIDEESFNQLPGLMGQMPQGIPDEIRNSIKFAEDKLKQMKLMPN